MGSFSGQQIITKLGKWLASRFRNLVIIMGQAGASPSLRFAPGYAKAARAHPPTRLTPRLRERPYYNVIGSAFASYPDPLASTPCPPLWLNNID